MKLLIYPALLATVLLTNCKKELKLPERPSPVNTAIAPGLPEDPGNIHGYMYLLKYNQSQYADVYAAFRYPAGNLMAGFQHGYNQVILNDANSAGNANLGAVRVGNYAVFANNLYATYYFTNSAYLSSIADYPTWSTDGNGNYKAFSFSVTRGFPDLNTTSISTTISSSVDLVIDPANICSNFDSVVVAFEYSSSPRLKKSSSGSPIVFSKSELATLRSQYYYPNLSIFAFNYSNAVANNKVYVFELGSRFSTGIFWTP